jgi:hypothetical protein
MKDLLPESHEGNNLEFFDEFVPVYFNDHFPDSESLERCRDWTMSSHKWRMFYVVFELLQSKHLTLKLEATGDTIFERLSLVMQSVLSSTGQVKNFNVKGTIMGHLFKALLTKSEVVLSKQQSATIHYLSILSAGNNAEWLNAEEKTKHVHLVMKHLTSMIDQEAL